jgi:hypothetical protein
MGGHVQPPLTPCLSSSRQKTGKTHGERKTGRCDERKIRRENEEEKTQRKDEGKTGREGGDRKTQ